MVFISAAKTVLFACAPGLYFEVPNLLIYFLLMYVCVCVRACKGGRGEGGERERERFVVSLIHAFIG